MPRFSVSLSIAGVLLLSACFGLEKLDRLRTQPLTGDSFAMALARHYKTFAEAEAARYDWFSAAHFADKGLRAARGEAVQPEMLAAWDLPPYARDELASARETVTAKLSASYRRAYPKQAAALLFHFDCWVEEQEEAWDMAAIDACRAQVFRHLQETDPPVRTGGPLSTSYLLYFPWDEAQLEGMALAELSDIAAMLRQQPTPYQLVINGHADRSGGNDYNLSLSQRRADFILDYLTQRGVPASRIEYYAFGESDPRVPTPDGIRQRANRRVELFIE